MNLRRTCIIATGLAAFGTASVAFAGLGGTLIEQVRQRDSGGGQSQSSAPSSPPPASAPAPAPQSSGNSSSGNNSAPRGNDGDSNRGATGGGGSPGNIYYRSRNQGSGGNDNQRDDRGGRGDRHDDRYRSPRVVYTLPPGYYDYYWNGNTYYNFNGGWYSPFGGTYVSVGAPYGLFVRSVPGYSRSFYYDDVRYYYSDDTYYKYDTARRGYVVVRSPYGDDRDDAAADEDMYVYPAQGQSEQQQADDRYACHRWAVKETGYDPIDDEYDGDRRAKYTRAMTACLSGRGYTVR